MAGISSTPSVFGGGRFALGEVSNTVKQPPGKNLVNIINNKNNNNNRERHQIPIKPTVSASNSTAAATTSSTTPLDFLAHTIVNLKPTELFPKGSKGIEALVNSSSGSDSEPELPSPIQHGQKEEVELDEGDVELDSDDFPDIEFMPESNYEHDYYPSLPDEEDLKMLRQNLKRGEPSDDEIWSLNYPKGRCPGFGHVHDESYDYDQFCGCGIMLEDLPDDETWFLNSTPVDANVVLSTIEC